MFNTTLATAVLHTPYVVAAIAPPADAQECVNWLAEIGFLEGEPVSVIARGALGGDPLVVRIGVSTFALRLAEARCVNIAPHAQTHLQTTSQAKPAAFLVAGAQVIAPAVAVANKANAANKAIARAN